MKRSPRAAFVVTFSLLGAAACQKTPASSSGGACEPPDCHMNPPPPPPEPVPISRNPPAIAPDAGAPATSATAK